MPKVETSGKVCRMFWRGADADTVQILHRLAARSLFAARVDLLTWNQRRVLLYLSSASTIRWGLSCFYGASPFLGWSPFVFLEERNGSVRTCGVCANGA